MFRLRALFSKQIIKRHIVMDNKSYGVSKTGVTMKIDLSETEAKICKVLQGVTGLIRTERPELPKIECRIAGGWVRDKVNAQISTDIVLTLSLSASRKGMSRFRYCDQRYDGL